MPPYEVDRERAAARHLTERELEVLCLAAEGMSSQEIGARLHISDITVRTHFGHVGAKLGAHSPTEVGARAVALGILRPPADDPSLSINDR